jgi:hypothetical protein
MIFERQFGLQGGMNVCHGKFRKILANGLVDSTVNVFFTIVDNIELLDSVIDASVQ